MKRSEASQATGPPFQTVQGSPLHRGDVIVSKATPIQLRGKDRLFLLDLESGDSTYTSGRVSFRRQHFLLVSFPDLNQWGVLQAIALLIEPA